MKFTSSAPRRLSILMAAVLLLEGGVPATAELPRDGPEPCLLLRFAVSSLPEDTARDWMDDMPARLGAMLRVRWIPPPASGETSREGREPPLPTPEALDRASRMIAEARRRLERMEMKAAGDLLSRADGLAREFRMTEAIRPLHAEIFLLRGIMLLWERDAAGAVDMFARSRALRPDFSPDPALFSPTVREAWIRAGERPPPEAEIIIRSLPPGAAILVDGEPRGVTPGRVTVRTAEPVALRIEHPGFRPFERIGRFLPGDAEIVEAVLAGDMMAALGEMLARPLEGGAAASILRDVSDATKASRIALLVLVVRDGAPCLDVFSFARGASGPDLLGRVDWIGGKDGAAAAAAAAARLLVSAGWPSAETEDGGEMRWYRKRWFWGMVGVVIVGIALAVGGSGGGGSAEGSAGTVSVTF
jgi:hypothetical protein